MKKQYFLYGLINVTIKIKVRMERTIRKICSSCLEYIANILQGLEN